VQDFLIQSLIASVVLTILINVLPRFFPNTTKKVERQVHETASGPEFVFSFRGKRCSLFRLCSQYWSTLSDT